MLTLLNRATPVMSLLWRTWRTYSLGERGHSDGVLQFAHNPQIFRKYTNKSDDLQIKTEAHKDKIYVPYVLLSKLPAAPLSEGRKRPMD